jgi:hypothetical protein
VAALAAAGLLAAPEARANTLVSTIYGVYDAGSCGDGPACLVAPPGQPLATGYGTNGGASGDTPSLFINNNTGFAFSDVTITLNAYQGINNGSVTTIPVSQIGGGSDTIAANTLYELRWSLSGGGYGNPVPGSGSNTSANLYSFDYDDYYAGSLGLPACAPEGYSYCERPGNFDVTFTAIWDNPAYNGGAGTPIVAQFSPDNTQGHGNVAGAFVGWEGLDPSGLAETTYDNHTGAETGVLADIFVGVPSTVPEPSTWAMLLMGFGGLGFAGYRARRTRIGIA